MPEPLVLRLPDTTKAVSRKYNKLSPLLSTLPKPVVSSLVQLDTKRAVRGQQPLSDRETAAALITSISGKPFTPPPTRTSLTDIPGNIVSDVRAITASIPRLPAALFKEVQDISTLPQALSEASSSGSLPELIAGVARAPGIRLLPGAYTIGNIAAGEGEESIAHPVFTALDLLPAAKSKAGVAARSTIGETAIGKAAKEGVRAVGESAARTQPGQLARQAFGRQARELSRVESAANRGLEEAFDPLGPPTVDPLVDVTRRANSLRTKYNSIPEPRRIELTKLIQEDPLRIPELSDVERAFVNDYRTVVDDIGKVGIEQGFLDTIDGEIYDTSTAAKIRQARSQRDRLVAIGDIRRAIGDPGSNTSNLALEAKRTIQSTDITKAQKVQMLNGYAQALDAAGFDTGSLQSSIRQANKGAISFSDLADQFDNLSPAPVLTSTQIIESLSPLAKTDPSISRLVENIRNENYSVASRTARNIARRTKFTVQGIEDTFQSIQRLGKRKNYLDKTSKFSPKSIERAVKKADQLLERTPPDRFIPIIEKEVQNKLLAKFSDNPDFDTVSQHIIERNYSMVPGLADEAANLSRELRGTWQDLKANGIDPVFVHRVTPERARMIDFPRVLESVRSPSWVKRRTNDVTPYVQDATVAVSHQGLELLARRASEEFVDTVTKTWGRTQNQLLEEYLPAARRRAEVDPRLDARGHAQRMINREYTQYNPRSIITWSGAKLTDFGEPIYLPKTVARNIELMHTPPTNRLTAITDPVMKAFRTSLLPLSPRWHLNNIIGGGMMLVAESPRAITYLRAARKMIKEGKFPTELPKGFGSVPREVLDWDKRAKTEFQFKSGTTLRRLYDEAGRARELASNGIQKSYQANAFFDDMYRAAAYLGEFDKSIKRGMSESAAHESGIQLTRKIFQNWDEMTPIERSVMRYVFPFYGFVSHIMRYVLRYPFDHPYRAEVMAAFTRNELNDMGDTLPERLLNSFFLGPVDDKGNVKSLQLAGMNPFGDVANYWTLAGFTSGLNPIASTFLEALGVDPKSGGPDLFPNLIYDPETGRLAAKNPGLLQTALGNVIPQSQILMSLTGWSGEFKELLKSNPEAASRLLRSQAGLPILFRNFNIPEEQTRAELARQEAQQSALSKGLKSGDFKEAKKYPGIQAIIKQIQDLQGTEVLEGYTPEEKKTSPLGALVGGLVRGNVP